VDKRKKTAAELEEIVKQRIGAGDFRVTIHRNPEAGWHATIYGRQPAEVHRCQVMADTIAAELCQHYELGEQALTGGFRAPALAFDLRLRLDAGWSGDQ
jgi:hypothetical protein